MKKRRIFAMLLTLVLMLSITACGGPTQSATAQPANKPPTEQTNTPPAGDTAAPVAANYDEMVPTRKYRIAFVTPHIVSTWMKQTVDLLEERVAYWEEKGFIEELKIANADRDTTVQIQQMESLIAQEYDAIIIIASSATAIDPVTEKAYDAGIFLTNMNSMVSTDKVHSKINVSLEDWGYQTAKWLCNEIGGEGDIVVMNGTVGLAVSEARYAGVQKALEEFPDVNVVAVTNAEYNEGAGMEVIKPVMLANPDLKGVWTSSGSFASAVLKTCIENNRPLIPVAGENFNGYLKVWAENKDNGFSSISTANPNWMVTLCVDQTIRGLEGYKVDKEVILPLELVTNENLDQYVPNDFPDDGYPYVMPSEQALFDMLGPLEKVK